MSKFDWEQAIPGVLMQGIAEAFQSHTPLLLHHCETLLLLQTLQLFADFLHHHYRQVSLLPPDFFLQGSLSFSLRLLCQWQQKWVGKWIGSPPQI
jgi:hypothetical protein